MGGQNAISGEVFVAYGMDPRVMCFLDLGNWFGPKAFKVGWSMHRAGLVPK